MMLDYFNAVLVVGVVPAASDNDFKKRRYRKPPKKNKKVENHPKNIEK